MYVIIVGCGSVGAKLAELLSEEGHNVVIIDQFARSFGKLGVAFNGVTVVGNGYEVNVLKEAGIERADCLAAVSNSDNANIMAAQVARQIFNVPRTIARVYEPRRAQIYLELGLEIISGTVLFAGMIRDRIVEPGVSSHLVRDRGLELIETEVKAGIAGRKVREVDLAGEFKVIALVKKTGTIIPEPEDLLEEGDRLTGVVRVENLKKIKETLG
jgi:trk system potassium uptake protein TrkA